MFDLTEGRVLPEAGGYNDQDPLLMEDFMTLSLIKQYHAIPEQQAPALGNNW